MDPALLVEPVAMPEWLKMEEDRLLGQPMPGNKEKMQFVLELARKNVQQHTGGPFAAAIFNIKTDQLAAAGINVVVPAMQSWCHAEMTAFAHAQNRLHVHDLQDCMLVTSCEPCAMCCGAVLWSGVRKMLYGATKAMAESIGFDEGDKGENWKDSLNRRGIEVVGPLGGEAAFEPFALYQQMNGKIY